MLSQSQAMAERTADSSAQRKRMRKGTRSCLECRTRKIRCIFPAGSGLCNSCKSQGKTCVEQSYHHVRAAGLDKRVGLKERVKELEALVHQLVEKGPTDSNVVVPERYRKKLEEQREQAAAQTTMLSPSDSDRSGESSPPQSTAKMAQDAIANIYEAVDDINEDTSDIAAPSAVHSLFDNSIISHDRFLSDENHNKLPTMLNRKAQTKYDRFSKELRAMIPPADDLKALCGEDMAFSSIWKEALTLDLHQEDLRVDEILTRFFQSSNLTSVSKGLLYYALLLQQLPADLLRQKLGFAEHVGGKALVQTYTSQIEEYLVSDDRIGSTLDGMECSSLVGYILSNDGRPRKAWIWIQRTISCAKLAGYHRESSWKTSDPMLGMRREKLFWNLYRGDRMLSLLLGLPYAIADNHVNVSNLTDRPGSGFGCMGFDSFTRKLAIISGKIIDRNLNPVQDDADNLTSAMQLDGELHALACQVPESFWNTTSPMAETQETIVEAYFRCKAVFMFCQCRVMLHTPFMMKHLQKGENATMFSYNRTVALKSARIMMRTHTNLRNRPEMTGIVCQILDFQVFTATMLLLLDMIDRPDLGTPNQDPQTLDDGNLALSVITSLRKVSYETSGRCDIAGQAVRVLDGVAHVLFGTPAPNESHPSRVVIPYFGTVTIKPVGNRKRKMCCPSVYTYGGVPPIQSTPPSSSVDGTSSGYWTDPTSSSVRSSDFTPTSEVQPEDTYQASDYVSFDMSMGTQQLNVSGSDSWGLPAGTTSKPDLSGWSGEDELMWDDVWQSMLQPEPILDLDGDWASWLPQTGN